MSSTLCFWTAQFLILDCTNCILDCTNWLDCTLRISPDFLGGNDASSKTTGQDESVRTHHTITLYLHAAALPSANDKSASSQKCLAQKCNKWLSRQQTVMPVKVKEVRRMTFSAVWWLSSIRTPWHSYDWLLGRGQQWRKIVCSIYRSDILLSIYSDSYLYTTHKLPVCDR